MLSFFGFKKKYLPLTPRGLYQLQQSLGLQDLQCPFESEGSDNSDYVLDESRLEHFNNRIKQIEEYSIVDPEDYTQLVFSWLPYLPDHRLQHFLKRFNKQRQVNLDVRIQNPMMIDRLIEPSKNLALDMYKELSDFIHEK